MGAQLVASKSLGPDVGQFYIIGDSSSVSLADLALNVNCNTTDLAPYTNLTNPVPDAEGTNTTFYPKATEIIQFYRASSFALALVGFNASALPAFSDDAPYVGTPLDTLPDYVDRPLLQCMNSTIAFIIPIMDPPHKHKLNGWEIFGIVIGSIVAALILLILGGWCYERLQKKSKKSGTDASVPPHSTPSSDMEAGPSTMTEANTSVLTLTTVQSHTTDTTAVLASSPEAAVKESDKKTAVGLDPSSKSD